MRHTATELERVRRDLATMRAAAGLDRPFGREVVYFWSVIAIGSAVLAAALAWGGWKITSIVLLVLWADWAVLLLLSIRHLARIIARRAEDPAPFHELRSITRAKLVAAPLLLGYITIQYFIGVPLPFLASALVFCGSIVTVIYAISSSARRWALGIALPGLFLSAVLPLLTPAQTALALALCATAIGTISASTLAWQLRGEKAQPDSSQ